MEESMEMILKAQAEGRSALSEHDSKQFLADFGIPVTREAIARDADEAAVMAETIGFPVVLKASGAAIPHKTEVGGVVLDLRNREDLKRESQRLLKIPGCEALLVQEMVEGARELVCGLMRDSQFGPCVMFGIGGVLTEIIEDIVFRIAPLTAGEAGQMVTDIRGKKILGPFRGEAAVDMVALCRVLTAMGNVGIQREDVLEIDVNPLKVRPDGSIAAVDALVVVRAV
jgi:acetate---CoA ligase (ADP-forming) subunit beta